MTKHKNLTSQLRPTGTAFVFRGKGILKIDRSVKLRDIGLALLDMHS